MIGSESPEDTGRPVAAAAAAAAAVLTVGSGAAGAVGKAMDESGEWFTMTVGFGGGIAGTAGTRERAWT